MLKKENKKNTHFYSLKKRLKVGMLCLYVALFAVVLVILVYTMVSGYSRRIDGEESVLKEYVDDLEDKISHSNEVVYEIYANSEAFRGLFYSTRTGDVYDEVYQVHQLLDMQASTSDKIDGIIVYYNHLDYYLYEFPGIEEYALYRAVLKDVQETVKFSSGRRGELILEEEGHYYYVNYFVQGGTAIAGITDLVRFSTIGEANAPSGYGIVFQGTAYDVSGTMSENARQTELEGLDGQMSDRRSILYYWTMSSASLMAVVEYENCIWRYVSIAHLLMLAAILLSIWPAVYVYRLLAGGLFEPLTDMTNTMIEIQRGNWEEHFKTNSHVQEIEEVRKALNTMTEEIEHSKIQAYEEKLNAQSARLQYLQLQLSPHFYINCLKLIQAMVQTKRYDRIEPMIIRLSRHFRYLMKNNTELVTVAAELEFTENYLCMQREAMDRSILFETDMDEQVRTAFLPMLSIQSFVENSVKYAGGDMRTPLCLRIRIKYIHTEEGTYLNLIFRDDGKGYPQEILELLNRQTAYETGETGGGILNLKRRMELIYREPVSCYFTNQRGAVSELLLPYRTEE